MNADAREAADEARHYEIVDEHRPERDEPEIPPARFDHGDEDGGYDPSVAPF